MQCGLDVDQGIDFVQHFVQALELDLDVSVASGRQRPVLAASAQQPARQDRRDLTADDRGVQSRPTARQRYGRGDEWRLRVVEVRLEKAGGSLRARMLCEERWLARRGIMEGGTLDLEMPEMGAVGRARVVAVQPCPPLPGRRAGYALVTATFAHESGAVCELGVVGEPKPIGVTATHPVWVPGRGWVPVGELEMGWRLLAADGSTPAVESLGVRSGCEPVYNIEVEGEHCYRVGQQGLLVHNNSVPAGQPTQGQMPSLQTCDCTQIVNNLRSRGGQASPTILASVFGITPADLWMTACQLYQQITTGRQGDSNPVTVQHAADHTVAIALVCITSGTNMGSFELWGTNSFRDAYTTGVTFRNGTWLVPTTQLPPWLPPVVRHAERRLHREAQRRGAMLVGIVASREVCQTCENYLAGVEILSPTANQGGTNVYNARVTCMGNVPHLPPHA